MANCSCSGVAELFCVHTSPDEFMLLLGVICRLDARITQIKK